MQVSGQWASTAPCMPIHDERQLVLECPAMQPVRDHHPALFSPACSTMQLFMWQPDTVGVAHYMLDCLDFLGALS